MFSVGHGHSGGERVLIDSIETYARDVIQHVEGIKAKHPDLPVFLFGHSMVSDGLLLWNSDCIYSGRGLV